MTIISNRSFLDALLLFLFVVLSLAAIADGLAAKSNKKVYWQDLERSFKLHSPKSVAVPLSVDSALKNDSPTPFSTKHPTLFRERHGWCPYSERVWLMMELVVPALEYDTIRIDNMGGPRPSYFSGQTPQMRWPEDGRTQGESMDLVYEIDERYCNGKFQSNNAQVRDAVSQFRSTFPRARPSSRAAYLFQMNGEPLWKSTFEETLENTNELLGNNNNDDGPYFCGRDITVADVAWAPFLERYRYQLPCLHEGLDPSNPERYPNLARWYAAMDRIPEYICRVKGDASSWRKVLTMAGFGNAGLPPQIESNMESLLAKEIESSLACIDMDVWEKYAQRRLFVQKSPHEEAAAIIVRNRDLIIADIIKQASKPTWKMKYDLPDSEEDAEESLWMMTQMLIDSQSSDKDLGDQNSNALELAKFLDDRMCVPRDIGAMAAATIKNLAHMGAK